LLLDIGQGAGLAGASGVRPFLPPLLAGALGRGNALGVDFEGTPYGFLEGRGFLLLVLGLAVASYAVGRARRGRGREATGGGSAASPRPGGSGPFEGGRGVELAFGLTGVALGALLFAGTLSDGGRPGWPGLVAGAVCAALGYAATATLFSGVRRRLEASRAPGPEASPSTPGSPVDGSHEGSSAAGLLPAYADASALALAALAVLVPPVSLLALAAFAWLLLTTRRTDQRKFAGLRVLR
jgi:hypothetical protein